MSLRLGFVLQFVDAASVSVAISDEPPHGGEKGYGKHANRNTDGQAHPCAVEGLGGFGRWDGVIRIR